MTRSIGAVLAAAMLPAAALGMPVNAAHMSAVHHAHVAPHRDARVRHRPRRFTRVIVVPAAVVDTVPAIDAAPPAPAPAQHAPAAGYDVFSVIKN